jgi:hypothetical protein
MEVCGEVLTADGSAVASSWCQGVPVSATATVTATATATTVAAATATVANTGSAYVTFAPALAARGDRFYLKVGSRGEGQAYVYGWSKGYFQLVGGAGSGSGDTQQPQSQSLQQSQQQQSQQVQQQRQLRTATTAPPRKVFRRRGLQAAAGTGTKTSTTTSTGTSYSTSRQQQEQQRQRQLQTSCGGLPRSLVTSGTVNAITFGSNAGGDPKSIEFALGTLAKPIYQSATADSALTKKALVPLATSCYTPPTAAPTRLYVTQVSNKLTGVSVALASSALFQAGFIVAVANVLKIDKSGILITAVSAATARRHLLQASAAVVTYTVTSTTLTTAAVQASLTPAALQTELVKALPSTPVTVGPSTVVDATPTSAPAAAGGLEQWKIITIVVCVVGGVLLIAAGGVVYYVWVVRPGQAQSRGQEQGLDGGMAIGEPAARAIHMPPQQPRGLMGDGVDPSSIYMQMPAPTLAPATFASAPPFPSVARSAHELMPAEVHPLRDVDKGVELVDCIPPPGYDIPHLIGALNTGQGPGLGSGQGSGQWQWQGLGLGPGIGHMAVPPTAVATPIAPDLNYR